ncbi:MAG: hypothetical protein ACI4I6_06880, partial [Hominimerdicola sp.]
SCTFLLAVFCMFYYTTYRRLYGRKICKNLFERESKDEEITENSGGILIADAGIWQSWFACGFV